MIPIFDYDYTFATLILFPVIQKPKMNILINVGPVALLRVEFLGIQSKGGFIKGL